MGEADANLVGLAPVGKKSRESECVRVVRDFGFTERQARFLVLVMRLAGVCVPRQYARFAGVAYGAKCNAFFDKLERRGFAVASACVHNRARLYQTIGRMNAVLQPLRASLPR